MCVEQDQEHVGYRSNGTEFILPELPLLVGRLVKRALIKSKLFASQARQLGRKLWLKSEGPDDYGASTR